jgi:flagellin-specific chaperone FliS
MMQTAYSRQNYREQEVMGASPLHLVVMAYDVAIQACEQKNMPRATQAISLLRDSLNFDYGDAATGLFRLYQWTLDCVRSDNYTDALKVLKDLRSAWSTVEKRLSPSVADVTQGVTIAAGL